MAAPSTAVPPEPACTLGEAESETESLDERRLLVLLDVLNKCNLRCVMCGYPDEADDPRAAIDLDRFGEIAAMLFPMSRQVNLSCSYEPLMHKDFFSYLETADRFGIPKATMTTNALLLDEEKVERLVASELTHLIVSVDGATKETFETIRVRANHDTFLDRLETLATVKQRLGSTKPSLQFNYVMLEENLHEMVPLVDSLSRYDPYKFVFIHHNYAPPPEERRESVEAALRTALKRCVEVGVIFEEVPSLVIPREEVLDAYGVEATSEVSYEPGCRDPWNFMRIRPSGDVQMCPGIDEPAGNLFESSLEEIWNGEQYRTLRQAWNAGDPPEVCSTCSYNGFGLTQMRRSQDAMEEALRDHLGV